jgi:hypothetical protein
MSRSIGGNSSAPPNSFPLVTANRWSPGFSRCFQINAFSWRNAEKTRRADAAPLAASLENELTFIQTNGVISFAHFTAPFSGAVMSIRLRCLHKDHKDETWKLDLDGDPVTLKDESGTVVWEMPANVAITQFQMPSFSESIKYFGILFGKEIRQFDVSKEGLKEIKTFLNKSVLAAGPEAVAAVRTKAIRDLLLGAACAIGGVVLTVGSYTAAAQKPEGGKYTVTYGLVIFGLIMLGRGVYGFVRHNQLKSLATE